MQARGAGTTVHGLPFTAADISAAVCGATHAAFLMSTGAVVRVALTMPDTQVSSTSLP